MKCSRKISSRRHKYTFLRARGCLHLPPCPPRWRERLQPGQTDFIFFLKTCISTIFFQALEMPLKLAADNVTDQGQRSLQLDCFFGGPFDLYLSFIMYPVTGGKMRIKYVSHKIRIHIFLKGRSQIHVYSYRIRNSKTAEQSYVRLKNLWC